MLNSITLTNFKSIGTATVPLKRMTVLVGPNNAGKSSVLQGVQFAVSVAQSLKLDGASRWRGDTTVGTLSTQQLVYTPLRDVHALARGGQLRQTAANAIRVEFDSDEGEAVVSVSRGKNKNISVSVTGRSVGVKLETLEEPYSVVAPGLAGIPSYEEYRSPGMVRRAAARGDANSVFRNVIYALAQDPDAWQEFHESLHVIFPDVDIEASFSHESDETIEVIARREGVTLPIDSCGTGILQAVQVLAYVGLYRPKLLILDEPDSHLHPDNQRKLARLLDDLTAKLDFQVLMSTHSRPFLDELHEGGAAITWFSSGAVQSGEYDHIRALMELGALDAADRLNHGQTPVIVVTEDTKLAPLRAVLESSGLASGGYDVWSYSGSGQTGAAVAIANFVHEKAPGTQVVVHRDRDYLSEGEVAAFLDEVQSAGAIPFVTTGTDVESHLLDLDHLQAIFPEVSATDLTSILDAATDEVREQSIKNMINARVEHANRRKRNGDSAAPSPGTIAAVAAREFDADPMRYRHGKLTLKSVRRQLQEARKLSRAVERPTPALEVPELRAALEATRITPA